MIRVNTENNKVFAIVDDDEASMVTIRELPAPKNGPDSPELSRLTSMMDMYQVQVIGGCVIESWSNPNA